MSAVAEVIPLPKLNRIEELQRTVSASRLNLWLQCRLKFYFRYALQIKKPATAALHMGTTVHAVLQAWNLARWRKEPFALERFKAVFDQGWQIQESPIDWDGEEDKQRQTAWLMLETFFAETPIKADERPEAVEVAVEADLSAQGLPTLIGIIDLVRAGGRIVDFKTTGKTPDAGLVEHQHEVQLSSYALLYRDATGRKESGIELHHLPFIQLIELAPRNPVVRGLILAHTGKMPGAERATFESIKEWVETTCDKKVRPPNQPVVRAADGISITVEFSETEYGRANYSVPRSGNDEFELDAAELLTMVQEAIDAEAGLEGVIEQIATVIDEDAWGRCDPDLDDYGEYDYGDHESGDSGNGNVEFARNQIRDRLLAFLRERHPGLLEELV